MNTFITLTLPGKTELSQANLPVVFLLLSEDAGLELGLPSGASGKEPTCQCRRLKTCGFDPWVGKIPWKMAWQPTPVFLPGESHGQRSLTGYSP